MTTDDSGTPKDKLIASKMARARDRRGLDGGVGSGRLPPGQRRVDKWPVLDLGVKPRIGLDKWRLRIDGAVENPVTWRWPDFLAQPQVEITSDIHCVTAWSRFDNRWQGVSAGHLLSLVRPSAEVRHVAIASFDSYTTNLPLEVFAAPDVLIAHSWNGAPLTLDHGAPARLVVPARYFWKSAKWIKRLTFVAADQPGFWEERGYHNDADPWREERYS